MLCDGNCVLSQVSSQLVFTGECPDQDFCRNSAGSCCLSKAISCVPIENKNSGESILYVYILRRMLGDGEVKSNDRGCALFSKGLYRAIKGEVSQEEIMERVVSSYLMRKKAMAAIAKNNTPALRE